MESKKLNIGCGEFPLKGFINLDIWKYPHVDLVTDARKLPFEDNSIEEIYFGHCIEHFTLEDARKVLSECFRVLETQGKIAIVIPDKNIASKEKLARTICENPYQKHLSYWDLDMLKYEVKKVGFERIEEMPSNYPHLVAIVNWQSGLIAYKGGKTMKKKSKEQVKEIDEVVPRFNEREYSWCKFCKKVVYNPNKKRHCPQCRKLL